MNSTVQFKNAYGINLTKKRCRELLGLLAFLELVASFSYLGYVNIPPISLTTLTILVIVAAMFFGPWDAAAVALVFAGTSVWTASSVSNNEYGDIIFSPFLSGKPVESLIMAVGARVLFALAAGFMFRRFFSKERKHRVLGISLISIAATLIHSALIYICMLVFFGAAGQNPGEHFWQSLIQGNLILFAATVAVVLAFDHMAGKIKTARDGSLRGVYALMIALLLILSVAGLIGQSGVLDGEPEVSVKPDNCYSETLRVITDADYKPYSFTDEKGNASGHDVEMITMMANELHMNLELVMLPWDDAIAAATRGEADVLMTCDYSDTFAGVDSMIKTEPTSTDDFIVFSKTKINSVDELYDLSCAVMENGNVHAQLKMLNLLGRCLEYTDNRQAMIALENGEADCAIMRYTVGESLRRELGYTDILDNISIGESYMCFAIPGENPALADEINGAIETLKTSGEAAQLHEKWLTTYIHTYTVRELIENNMWLFFIMMLAVVAILLSEIRNDRRRQEAESEKSRYMEIVENLSNDFECVNYIELHEDKYDDVAVLLRTSETLVRNVPGWATETGFTRRLEIFTESVIPPEDRVEFLEKAGREAVLSALRDDDAYFVNFRAIIDGEPSFYQLKYSPVRDEDGNFKAIVLGVHDVDKETKKEIADMEALQTARKAAEAASAAKTSFLFNMSHDIRTPMNAIIGFTNKAKKEIDDRSKALESLDKVQKSGDILLSLINDVLDMSRIESGKAVIHEEKIDMAKVYDKVDTVMGTLAASKDIDLTFGTAEFRDRYVFCDPNRFNRILTNIISNAVKYTPAGGKVDVFTEQIEDGKPGYASYKITVADNGIGMSEEFQEHMFEDFTREENSTTSGIQGTGLGLPLAKSFVESMGGSIECRSRLGEGTTFTFTIPMRIQTEEERGSYLDEQQKKCEVDLSGRRVLLVEDNELNRELASDILEDEGIIFDEAENGQVAVNMVASKGLDYYDFILMDIQMPIMNGYEATKIIRSIPGGDRVPVIALSANAFEEDRKASLDAGMNDHVAKPINVNHLKETVAKYL